MSREIKFRAWHAGIRFKGTRWAVKPQMLYDEKPGDCLVWKSQGQNIEQVMQYTGLKDRNGKEIYEGDILSNGSHIDWIVKYRDAAFQVEHVGQITNDSWHLERGMAESREVIGNIYENPELLGGSDT